MEKVMRACTLIIIVTKIAIMEKLMREVDQKPEYHLAWP